MSCSADLGVSTKSRLERAAILKSAARLYFLSLSILVILVHTDEQIMRIHRISLVVMQQANRISGIDQTGVLRRRLLSYLQF